MPGINHKNFANTNEYIRFPKTLLFEITLRGARLYTFYRGFPRFIELLGNVPVETFDQLIYNMQDKNSMVSFQDCLERFGEENGEGILDMFKFLTKRGLFEAYNFERLAIDS